MTVDLSLFTFAYDIADEGAQVVVDNIVDRAGANGVLMAVTYHGGRDVFPHGRSGRVRYLEPGATFFRPDHARYRDSAIKPHVSELLATGSPLEELVAAAGRRSAQVLGWTVFLHHDRIGELLPYCPRNAFGDAVRTNLCISHPVTRAYARALAADIAHQGVTTVLAEALHHAPLEHGVQHERYLVPLGPRTRFLLGLCFCAACLGRAVAEGIDGESLRAWAQARIEDAFERDTDDPPGDLTRAEMAGMAGGDMGGYLTMRELAVTSLVAEIRHLVAEAGARLAFIDPSGATKGFTTGRPTGAASPTGAWQAGLDLERLASAADQVEVLGYAADPARVGEDLDAFRAILGPAADLAVTLRPSIPDSTSVEDLRRKIELALHAGATRLDFYHYGLMRLDALDRIREAASLAAARVDAAREGYPVHDPSGHPQRGDAP